MLTIQPPQRRCAPASGFQARAALFALLALVLGVTGSSRAQVGGASAVFLQIEPDSRAAGMGNANVALADNANAIFWNPAGLAFQEGAEAAITHSNWLPEFNADLFYEYLVGKYHVPGWGTFGAHLTYFNLGEHERRDENNTPLGTFKSYEMAAGVSYGFQLSEQFALGTGVRLIYSNLAGGVSVGEQQTKAGVSTGIDLAGLYRTGPIALGGAEGEFSAGFNLANMGPKIQYSDAAQADPIPTNLRMGWSFRVDFDQYNSLALVNDFTKLLVHRDTTATGEPVVDPFYKAIFTAWEPIRVNTGTASSPKYEELGPIEQLTIGTGLEYWYNRLFALRAGYFYEDPYNGNRQFLTFGAGLRYNILGVDFSYIYPMAEDSPLANTMRFSLLLNFGQR